MKKKRIGALIILFLCLSLLFSGCTKVSQQIRTDEPGGVPWVRESGDDPVKVPSFEDLLWMLVDGGATMSPELLSSLGLALYEPNEGDDYSWLFYMLYGDEFKNVTPSSSVEIANKYYFRSEVTGIWIDLSFNRTQGTYVLDSNSTDAIKPSVGTYMETQDSVLLRADSGECVVLRKDNLGDGICELLLDTELLSKYVDFSSLSGEIRFLTYGYRAFDRKLVDVDNNPGRELVEILNFITSGNSKKILAIQILYDEELLAYSSYDITYSDFIDFRIVEKGGKPALECSTGIMNEKTLVLDFGFVVNGGLQNDVGHAAFLYLNGDMYSP